ncbi:hypothetical protein [Streptomyces sp. NPDC059816]|uniref:hypothetical protein n=1 Tax=Streptomyces sp. NPDC059816 TaxID=3346960 RepID=UPI0036641570
MGRDSAGHEDGDRDDHEDRGAGNGGVDGLSWVTIVPGPPTRQGPPGIRNVDADRRWATDRRDALCCALALLGLICLVDLGNATLSAPRAALWAALSLLLYAVLHPPLVTAGPGWLAVRGLCRTRRVATDLLISARHGDGIQPRLVLRDALGNRVEVDPRVLTGNPLIWHRLDTGARHARANGLLRTGTAVLEGIGEQLDVEEARAVFEVSHLS